MWVVGLGSTERSTTVVDASKAIGLDLTEIYVCQLR